MCSYYVIIINVLNVFYVSGVCGLRKYRLLDDLNKFYLNEINIKVGRAAEGCEKVRGVGEVLHPDGPDHHLPHAVLVILHLVGL